MAVSRPQVLAGLGSGVVVLSFASVIIRVTPAPSIVIAAGRMAVATLVLTPFFWARFPARRAEFKGVGLWPVLLSGVLLAVHFALWIESLNRTSVASSVVLVAMNPIFAAALSPLVLHERVSWRIGLAVVLGIIGAAVIAGPQLGSGAVTVGNLLALGGAACAAGYLMAGRRVRSRLSLLSYVYVVYGIAAVLLLVAMLSTGHSFIGHKWQVYLFIGLLGLGPQLIGHTTFNWALRYVPAPTVAMAVLGEPVGTTILAWLILRQAPTAYEAIGGAVICAGIYLAAADVPRLSEPAG
ncbi:MAG: DMT family transporter [candidate division WOR-3 bacterium]|nr:DMT family transporter [candidate division WOR-3 bacterium]